ncbi:MAG: response regulator [Bacteroidota bacterium]
MALKSNKYGDSSKEPINILLADDDIDDCFFFKNALSKLSISTQLKTVDDGERLMTYLSECSDKLPDVLFLDLNMPRKNGSECLKEIKLNKKFQHLPVIIYSTCLHEAVADELYTNGAYYYIRKASLEELQKVLHRILTIMVEKKITRPLRNEFVFSLVEK